MADQAKSELALAKAAQLRNEDELLAHGDVWPDMTERIAAARPVETRPPAPGQIELTLTCICGVSFGDRDVKMLRFHEECPRQRFIHNKCPDCGNSEPTHYCPKRNPNPEPIEQAAPPRPPGPQSVVCQFCGKPCYRGKRCAENLAWIADRAARQMVTTQSDDPLVLFAVELVNVKRGKCDCVMSVVFENGESRVTHDPKCIIGKLENLLRSPAAIEQARPQPPAFPIQCSQCRTAYMISITPNFCPECGVDHTIPADPSCDCEGKKVWVITKGVKTCFKCHLPIWALKNG